MAPDALLMLVRYTIAANDDVDQDIEVVTDAYAASPLAVKLH